MLSIEDHRAPLALPDAANLARHVLWDNGADDAKIALTRVGPSRSERWSYGRLRREVLSMGGKLRAQGLTPGDRLLLRLGNSTAFPLAFLGAVSAGILPVPTSAALTEAEIQRVADVLGPKAILAEDGIAVPRGAPVWTPETLTHGVPLDAPRDAAPDDPAYIIFTSGTSGAPVGVVHAHRAIYARQMMVDGWYGLRADDRMLHAGAFNWTYTLGTGLLDPWAAGASALIPREGLDAKALALLLARHEVTLFAAAPGLFRRLLREPLALPHLRCAFSAGETLPDRVRAAWREATGTEIHEAFGQSECSTFLSGSPARPAPSGSLGFVQPGRAAALIGPDGPVPRGEPGEIAVHRTDPGLMLGYLGDAVPRFSGDWYLTGDMGRMHDDGSIIYEGRTDDLLTAGGFRVSPLEIEDAMASFPGLREAAAVDQVVAEDTVVIALHYAADAPLPEADLAAHAARHLARHKQPRTFIHHSSLPRNQNGKLLRRRLRADNETS